MTDRAKGCLAAITLSLILWWLVVTIVTTLLAVLKGHTMTTRRKAAAKTVANNQTVETADLPDINKPDAVLVDTPPAPRSDNPYLLESSRALGDLAAEAWRARRLIDVLDTEIDQIKADAALQIERLKRYRDIEVAQRETRKEDLMRIVSADIAVNGTAHQPDAIPDDVDPAPLQIDRPDDNQTLADRLEQIRREDEAEQGK